MRQSASTREESNPLPPYLAYSSSSALAEAKCSENGRWGNNGLVRKRAEKPSVVQNVATFFSNCVLSAVDLNTFDRKLSSPPFSLAESAWQYDWVVAASLLLDADESGGADDAGPTKAAASFVRERTVARTRADDDEFIMDLDRLPVFIDVMTSSYVLALR